MVGRGGIFNWNDHRFSRIRLADGEGCVSGEWLSSDLGGDGGIYLTEGS